MVNNGILLRGSNSGGNTFNVQSTLTGSTTEIDGDGTNDIFNVASDAPTNNGNLAGIRGTLTVKGGSGTNNRLIVSDYGDPSTDTGVTVTNNSVAGFAPAGTKLERPVVGVFLYRSHLTDAVTARSIYPELRMFKAIGCQALSPRSSLAASPAPRHARATIGPLAIGST